MKLVVLYPQPKDVQKFNSDYNEHILFLNKKLNMPADMTAFVSGPFGEPAYYKMWVMPFDSQEALNAALSTPEFQAVAADVNRISNGGAPTLMIGA